MQISDFNGLNKNNLVPIGAQGVAFVPPGLPPASLTVDDLVLLSQADQGIGRLSGLGQTLPNPHLLIRPYARREAVLSSKIEGTQSDYEDAVLFELEPSKSKAPDADEIRNYIAAMDHGIERLKELPLCRRLICEAHEKLLASGRGQNRSPGRFRQNQVWIGSEGMPIEDARYVPPPTPQMEHAFDQLELFLNNPPPLPLLVRMAMVHYQIEAIHPFEDGNGRIGRMLIVLMLCAEGVLPQPLLYLSAYFEKYRQEYYDRLLRVSTHGDWSGWIAFFLKGIISQSADAIERSSQLTKLREKYHMDLHGIRASSLLLQLTDRLFEQPATMGTLVKDYLGVTHTTAMTYLRTLVERGVVVEVTGGERDKIFVAKEIIRITNAPLETIRVETP